MEELTKGLLPPYEVKLADNLVITRVKYPNGFTYSDSIDQFDGIIVACQLYKTDSSYDLAYLTFNNNGDLQSQHVESEGILPSFLKDIKNDVWISLTSTHSEKEITIPISDRKSVFKLKETRSFTGDFIGVIESGAILFDIDLWSEKKPDRIMCITFKGNELNQKKIVKIEFPKKNSIVIENNEIHLLAKEDVGFLHREIDDKGVLKRSRTLDLDGYYIREGLRLNFNHISLVLAENDLGLYLLKIDPDGSLDATQISVLDDQLFNTWKPLKVDKETYVIRFNTEFGNGWMTFRNGELMECFYSKNVTGYKCLLTNRIIELGIKKPILAGINLAGDEKIAIIVYYLSEEKQKSKELIIIISEL